MHGKSRKACFSRIAIELMKPLYRYAYWLSGDAGAAEELLQKALARAWSDFDDLHDERAAKHWLFTILRSEFLRRPNSALQGNVFTIEDSIPVESASLDQVPNLIDMRYALEQLPTDYREALLLQAAEGFSLQEIAELLDVSLNTAAARALRARLKLRDILSSNKQLASAGGLR